jgi:hypothetical protein
MVQVIQAGLCRDHEAGRHVDADLGHFAQVGTLAAQQHLVAAVAILEGVNVFLRTVHHVSPGNTKSSDQGAGTGDPVQLNPFTVISVPCRGVT